MDFQGEVCWILRDFLTEAVRESLLKFVKRFSRDFFVCHKVWMILSVPRQNQFRIF